MESQEIDFDQLFAELEKSDIYWFEGIRIEFAEEVCKQMELQGVTEEELAKRLGKHISSVKRIFTGNSAFDLKYLVRIAKALNCEINLTLKRIPNKQ